LDADLIDEMFSTQVRQMCPLFLIREVRTDSVGHDQNESPIIHIQPVGTTDKLIVAVSDERAVNIFT
jgi:hypothetical protein